jgi:hypothetical protein
VVLGSTQPLTEVSTRNLLGGKGLSVRGAEDLTAICVQIVYIMRKPQHFTTLWALTACYKDSFTFYSFAEPSRFHTNHFHVMMARTVVSRKPASIVLFHKNLALCERK